MLNPDLHEYPRSEPEDALPVLEAKREPCCPDPSCQNVDPRQCERCAKRSPEYYDRLH